VAFGGAACASAAASKKKQMAPRPMNTRPKTFAVATDLFIFLALPVCCASQRLRHAGSLLRGEDAQTHRILSLGIKTERATDESRKFTVLCTRVHQVSSRAASEGGLLCSRRRCQLQSIQRITTTGEHASPRPSRLARGLHRSSRLV